MTTHIIKTFTAPLTSIEKSFVHIPDFGQLREVEWIQDQTVRSEFGSLKFYIECDAENPDEDTIMSYLIMGADTPYERMNQYFWQSFLTPYGTMFVYEENVMSRRDIVNV